ncbi:hypothetical protein Dthio_PD0389 [Desulfonatronospira thiodismutans ASO3-1]|uniref:Uncharacterized protein n=1 Tax=Desulfonatronospira thiodismutans ASO3-1 TaxID=555779 RepID=D6SUU5_9BACT|nr:hypothetical protein Dthio_PD0389 [Desulfonatronospira thiodismutans ASO3-1]
MDRAGWLVSGEDKKRGLGDGCKQAGKTTERRFSHYNFPRLKKFQKQPNTLEETEEILIFIISWLVCILIESAYRLLF